ncbi:hypothetical protein GDO78_000426 [Eleutherodactylus coqui]|uniref:USP domain-containing protein n=2 Tax=Eleutherodactylus coqui TaxID=57060 RepID=A0A8J6FQM0_ELECQ|nr:hypothetical protein GDO78_000426 [Eleutherodactylus coqui]
MVGCMGKNPQSIGAPHDGWCPVCKTKGQTQALKTYRINFTQSIFLCTNPQCIYPLGYTPLDNIIANTADLKKSSPNKRKKHNVTDLSPTSLACEKKQKIDPPISSDSPNVQADLCKSMLGFPALDCETVSPTRLQHGQKECSDSQMPDISETSNVLSNSTLWDKSSFPILPTGYLSTHVPGQCDGVPAVLESHQDVSQNGHLALMHTLGKGSLLPPVADKIDNVQEKVTESLKEPILNGLASGSDYIPSCVSPPTPLLQNSQQECQVKENSSKETSLSASNTGGNSGSRSDTASSFEFLKDKLSLVEPLIEQMENIDNLTVEGKVEAALCNKEATLLIQHSLIEISGNKVSPDLRHDESDQPMNLSLETSLPTRPDDGVQVNSFGSADLSRSLQMMQESGDKMAVSNSLEEVIQESHAEGCSFTDLWKPVSSPCLVVKDRDRSCPALSSDESEESLSESMSDDDFNTPMDLTCPLPHRSMVSTEEPPIPNLSLLQELVQSCQKTNSEEHCHSKFSQDMPPESRVGESALKNSTITSVPSIKDQAHADAAAISLPGNDKKGMTTDSLMDNPAVCHPNDSYSEKVCEPHNSSSSIVKDDCNEHRDARSLNKIPSPGPQISLQDCLKCHFGTNMSLQSVLENTCNDPTTSAPSVKDQVCADAAATSSSYDTSANAHTDAKPLDKISLPSPQILLQDYLKCHCGMNTSQTLQNTHTLDTNSAPEVCSSLCAARDISDSKNVSAQSDSDKDSNTVSHLENKTTASPSDCKSPLSKQKKEFYESTILPDLLLDIQPEHRMEEARSACPSPQSDPTVSMTMASDEKVIKQDVWQKVKEGDKTVEPEAMEVLIDNIQNGSKLSDTLEISLNVDLADDASEAMETNTEDSAQVSESPALKKFNPTERHLQWKNKHSLCWLDCILSALVLSETVNHFVANSHLGKESIIHNLFTRYDEATTMYIDSLDKQKPGKRSDYKRPKYEKCLNEVRMEIFEKLQPLLNCKLGKRESPVFAFPLLLGLDPETEKLYMHSFMWQFKCEACGYSYQQRCQKTLTTFTNVVPEWHPLNAVHSGPCNQCQDTEQKRSMVLEKLNEIFMVHFVGGLPNNDLNEYSFQFKGHLYEVKAIIKFRNKHFSTWISNTDGTWLESDDLRGSFCRRYQKFRVRADDLHIVIWERSNGKTLSENVQLDTAEQDSEYNSTNLSMASPDQTLSSMAAAELSQQVAPILPSVALNTSNPLAGMEGYTDDDVITLTLVEVPLDANGRPVETVPELQQTNTCTTLKEANQGESMHTVQPESQGDYALESEEMDDANVEPAPLRNCRVVLSPLKQSPLKSASEAVATSTPIQQPCNTKTSAAGNWMTRLISNNKTILNSDPLANKNILALKKCSPLKETDVSGVPKKAQNFNGFQGRNLGKTGLLESHIFSLNIASKPHFSPPKEKGAPIAKPLSAPTASGFRMPGSRSLDYSKLLKEEGSSRDDKIRKLRLKLLKKLKGKKNELAALEKLAKKQQRGPLGEQASGGPHGGFNRKEHLRGFWQELQEHIDNADNESVCTMSSSTSICSSPGDAEFFSELFSPSPGSQPSDSNYLEMLADGCGIAAAGQSQQANGHQGEAGALQSTSGSNACSTSTTQNGSSRDESLNLMSNSTLTILNEENSYFNFDDFF